MKKIYLTLAIVCALLSVVLFLQAKKRSSSLLSPLPSPQPLWLVRSIDTMKYSRDIAREKANDKSFDAVIDQQVSAIAQTGATHVAIATPYDDEFIPYLTRWVTTARKYNLNIWFRGNLAGWEKWFNYPPLDREAHIQAIDQFIRSNGNLFANGDIFTPCPECENGGTGDPRMVGDVEGYRNFLISEYNTATSAFRAIGKNVSVGYFSMNFDVAKLIMDPPTTQALGGIVAIDHYVQSTAKLGSDLRELAQSSGGKIYLGEWGAPIPDIHGKLSDEEQADWIRQALEVFRSDPNVIGLNYWVNVGGSSAIWKNSGEARPAVSVITEYYSRLEIPERKW